MKFLNGEYYVEVKCHRYKSHLTENVTLRKRDLPNFSQHNIRYKITLR